MATAAVGRGPLTFLLQSSGTQWVFIGAIGLGIVGTDRVRSVLVESITKALQLSQQQSSQLNNQNGERSGGGGGGSGNMPPIVIHTGSNSSGGGSGGGMGSGLLPSGGIVGLAFQVTLGAVTCWAAYGVISNASFIPDIVKEVLPVSRKLFDRAVKSLGEGIIHVRDSLSEQMAQLSQTQDELSKKQDKTLSEIDLVKGDVGDARQDLERMLDSLSRCESSLGSTQHVSNYTAKGVRLLVRCVAGMLPGNDRVLTELVQYIKEAEHQSGGSADDTNNKEDPSLPPTTTTSTNNNNNNGPSLVHYQESSTPEDELPSQPLFQQQQQQKQEVYTIRGKNTSVQTSQPHNAPLNNSNNNNSRGPPPPPNDHLHEIHSLLGFVNSSAPIKT
jgi:hypothetical protein